MDVNPTNSSIGGSLGPSVGTVEGGQKKIDADKGHDVPAMSMDLGAARSAEHRGDVVAQGKQKSASEWKAMEGGVFVRESHVSDSSPVYQIFRSSSSGNLASEKIASIVAKAVKKHLPE